MKSSIYNFYKEHYNLIKLDISITSKKMLFLIYDDEYYYYLKKNKFLDTNKDLNILDTIKNINKIYNTQIINYYPVCFCNDTLILAFRTNHLDNSNLQVVDYKTLGDKYKKLIKFHRDSFEKTLSSLNIKKEILMSQKYIKRYKFHENFIKKYILTEKKRKTLQFKKLLFNMIPNKKSIIDVSCGDNSYMFEIAKVKKYETIVGNDICLNYFDNENGVIYTNDNVIDNNVKRKSYDVSYCKNTLHHMNNFNSIKKALSYLDKISNEIIIIEIVDPKQTGGLSKFLNKYLYTKFLKDVGTCYLTDEQFKNLINSNFTNHFIEYSQFKNILGVYSIAKIKRRDLYENKS